MNRFRSWCSLLFGYDWVGIPLVYTQVSNPWHVVFPSHCLLWHAGSLGAARAVLSAGFLSVSGGHTGCLHLLLCLPDRTPVFGSHQRLCGAWLRSLHPNLHSPTVLLLRRMAQGSQQCPCLRPSPQPRSCSKFCTLLHHWIIHSWVTPR